MTGSFAAAMAHLACARRESPSAGILQGGFRERSGASLRADEGSATRFRSKRAFRFDVDRRVLIEVASAVPIHVLEAHPLDANLCVASAKRSDIASLIDWGRRKEARTLRLPPGQYFYGHAAFTPSGDTVLLTAYSCDAAGCEYRLLIVDVETFSIRDAVPLPFGSSHDVVHIGGSRFAIGGESMNGPPPLGLFDLGTGALETVPSPPGFVGRTLLSHLLSAGGGRLLAVACQMSGHEVAGGSLVEYDLQARASRQLVPRGDPAFGGELLSFEVAANGDRVWFSVPDARQVLVWSTPERRIARTLKFETSPRSVALLGDGEIIAVGTDERFYAFDAYTARRLERLDSRWPASRGNGAFCPHTRLIRRI